jgi:RNA polymerase sigma-70 factor (ECF subfamily)
MNIGHKRRRFSRSDTGTDTPAYSEQVLMERVCQRDQLALAVLYERFGDAVYGLALHIVQNAQQAEEIAQDVFVKVWERAPQWDNQKSKLSTWILAITRHAAIDRLRYEKRRPPLIEAPLDKVLSLLPVQEWQNGQQLRLLLQQLPPEQVQVLHLAFFEGLSHQEIANLVGIPLGTVKTRLRLGLQKLRKLWGEK